jgi:hypothetical protein
LAATLAYASGPLGLSSDLALGVEAADESVVIARTLGNKNLLASAVNSSGLIRARVDPATAIDLLEEAFALPGAQSRRFAFSRTWKAVAHMMMREYPAAARELSIALPGLQEGGETYQQSIALGVAASVLSRPQPDVALRLLAAIDQQRADGHFMGAADDLAVQAHLVDRLRARLDPSDFDAQWSDGRSLTLDDAIALAVDALALVAESG